MKILFAGTPTFSSTILSSLANAGHEIVGVVTQPDRRQGRGMITTPSQVKQLALSREWALFQPNTLKTKEAQQPLLSLGADVFIVAAYGQMIPQPLLTGFSLGAINVHASLLPRWRGAAPIERAIAAGDIKTGISIMKINSGLDEGPVFMSEQIDIKNHESAHQLETRLSILGGESLLNVLNKLPEIAPVKQNEALATYAKKITTKDGFINFTENAETLYRHIKAFSVNPGCFFIYNNERIRIGSAELFEGEGFYNTVAGNVLEISKDKVLIQCADKPIKLLTLQRPGRKMMGAFNLFHGWQIGVGHSII